MSEVQFLDTVRYPSGPRGRSAKPLSAGSNPARTSISIMRKLFVKAFGCQMSVADGEEMARPLLNRGFAPTDKLEEADAVILNTCTVRQHAEDRALSLIGRLRPWKEEHPDRFLIVAGCAAECIGQILLQ